MNKRELVWIILPFLTITFGLGGLSFAQPDQATSVVENRPLQQQPGLAELQSGQFAKSYDAYFSDQFVGRDEWVKMYTQFQLDTGKTFTNGYHVTKEGWILDEQHYTPKEKMNEAAKVTNALASKFRAQGKEVYYVLTPWKTNMVAELYPDYVDSHIYLEDEAYFVGQLDQSKMKIMDMGAYFLEHFGPKEREAMFFKTDHHWNMKGAFEGYKYLIQQLVSQQKDFPKIQIKEGDYLEKIVDTKPFLGSWEKQLYGMVKSDEKVGYRYPKQEMPINYYVYDYNKDKLIKRNPKEIIAGGYLTSAPDIQYFQAYVADYGYWKMTNDKAPINKKILIYKDSYFNAMSWLIGGMFKEVEVVDVRFLKELNGQEIGLKSQADIVFFMHNDHVFEGSSFQFDHINPNK